MSQYYQRRMDYLRDKTGVTKIEIGPSPPPPVASDESKIYKRHIAQLKDKWHLAGGLQLEGLPEGQSDFMSLETAVEKTERDDMAGLKLAYGSTRYKGKKLNVFFTISK